MQKIDKPEDQFCDSDCVENNKFKIGSCISTDFRRAFEIGVVISGGERERFSFIALSDAVMSV